MAPVVLVADVQGVAMNSSASGLDELFLIASSLWSLVMRVGYAMRFEIIFFSCAATFWIVSRFTRKSRVLPKGKQVEFALPRKPTPVQSKEKSLRPHHSQATPPAAPGTAAARRPNNAVPGYQGCRPGAAASQNIARADLTMHEMPNAEQLTDAAWLVPRIINLCNSNAQRAVEVYRVALAAGLDLRTMAAAERESMYMALVTAMVRMGLIEEAKKLLCDLRDVGAGVPCSILASMSKLCTAKHLFQDSLALYDLVADHVVDPLADKTVWSCLLFCAIETRAYSRCAAFFESLKAAGKPSQKDYWNMIRLGSMRSDCETMLKIIQEMRDQKLEIDSVIYNTVLATCVSCNQIDQARQLLEHMDGSPGCTDVITYNTLMKGYAKKGNMVECFQLFQLMSQRDLKPSQVTYGILLDGYINDSQVDKAAAVYELMTQQECPMNTVLFTTMIKGFAREGKVEDAMRIYSHMIKDQSACQPDLITFSILLKANCDAGDLEVSLELLGKMHESGLRPDEVIFNNLLAGCAKKSNAELAKRLYNDMVQSGVRPSNATFSILIRLFSQCKMLDEAADLLTKDAATHKVDLEPRLFSQLIQCCIRARQGRRAVDMYKLMMEQSTPTAATHSCVFGICAKLNMFDTAADLLVIAAAKAGSHCARIDPRDANQLLEGALRKRKTACAKSISSSMALLGMEVQPSIC